MSRQHQHNYFNKNEIRIKLKSFLTLTARKSFVFILRFRKQTSFVIVFFQVGEKNCIVKNEKTQYVNSNPGQVILKHTSANTRADNGRLELQNTIDKTSACSESKLIHYTSSEVNANDGILVCFLFTTQLAFKNQNNI